MSKLPSKLLTLLGGAALFAMPHGAHAQSFTTADAGGLINVAANQAPLGGSGLTGAGNGSEVVGQQLGGLNLSAGNLTNNRSGEIHASVHADQFLDSDEVMNPMMARLGAGIGEPNMSSAGVIPLLSGKATGWLQLSGQTGHTDHGLAGRMNTHYAGFTGGMDTKIKGWTVGGALSYGRSMINIGMRNSNGYSNNVVIGGYAGRKWGNLGLKLGASYGFNMIHQSRDVYGMDAMHSVQHINSSYLGGVANAKAELAYTFHPFKDSRRELARNFTFEPFIDAEYANVNTASVTEHGGNMALHAKHSDNGMTFGAAGFRTATSFKAFGVKWSPHIQANYQHEFGENNTQNIMSFANSETAAKMGLKNNLWRVGGNFVSQNVAYTEAGIASRITERLNLNVNYFGGYGNHNLWTGGTGGMTYSF